MEMISKLITIEEIEILREPLERLHKHHNSVSEFFSGSYPRITFEKRVEEYKANTKCGEYRIELLSDVETDNIIGFCIAYNKSANGKIEVLFVNEEHRGRGLGAKLMNNAIEWFASKKILEIELTVVYGNDAASFYQKLGFYPQSIIMTRKINK